MKFAIVAAFLPAIAAAQWKTPWTYDAVDRWSALDPDYAACAGKQQSPIDIRHAEKVDLPALRFDYHAGPLKFLLNNGAAIRVNYHDAANFLVVGPDRYPLTQFHFHRPSEETVDGKSYAMEIHLMHQSGDGRVVGVTVFLRAGASNATVQKIWDHMPVRVGPETEIPGVEIDPASLLPRDLAYYRYAGSLTAPPCTEGVTWFVLRSPIAVSRAQIDAFAKLYPHNVRPVQPLNGRTIQVSK
jgi:carbonic anhydrase